MTSSKLTRRSLLRGIAGVSMALPALEIMGVTPLVRGTSTAAAGGPGAPPKRFVLSYGGTSIGSDRKDLSLVIPATLGAGYEVTRALQPLADFDVRDEVTVISNMRIPYAEDPGDGSEIPPGGRPVEYHRQSTGPQLAGTHAGPKYSGRPKAPTADQIVADDIAGSTVQRVLTYRVQAATYVAHNGSENNTSGAMSYRLVEGQLRPVGAVFSPRLAYQSLFSGFTPPDSDPEQVRRAEMLLRQRGTVIDLVKDNADRLARTLGKADRERMEQHFDELRGMERRLDEVEPRVGGACAAPAGVEEDPPIAGAIAGSEADYDGEAGYSNEDLRGDLLADFITMAFACDLSRVANYWLTYGQSFMNMNPIAGHANHMHGLTHAGNAAGAADAVAWHVKQIARLTQKLRDTPEVDGSTLLDHTAVVLVFEGGHGFAPDSGIEEGAHSTDGMLVVVAGRAGGLARGVHIDGLERHPARAVRTAMNAVGVAGDTLGEVTGTIPELLS